MTFEMLKGKIHRATVVQAELDYVGSITVDEDLLDSAGILEYEKVSIVDINNGNRFETYTIAGERGSGMICLNGAAARCVQTGDKIIIMCYAQMTPEEVKKNPPKVVFVDEDNKISRVARYENMVSYKTCNLQIKGISVIKNVKGEEYVICPRCEQEVYKEVIIYPFCNFGIMAWLEGENDENSKPVKDKSK